MKKVLLSAVKPTGRPHIGNYFGAMKQFVELQDKYESYIFIADLHALTTIQDKDRLNDSILEVALDYLAIGLDPQKTTLFKQSDTPQVTELAWIFDCLTTMPYLMRAHAFKDAEAKNKEINVGVFNYPVLMAADILITNADVVPVGQDQKQHIEITGDIADKFNRTFGQTFKKPEALIVNGVATIQGTDGQKMSKSYNNTIPLFASKEEIVKAVMSIKTDSASINEPKDPKTNNIFNIHKLVLSKDSQEDLRKRYLSTNFSYKEAKDLLVEDLEKFIAPMREKRKLLEKNKAKVIKILKKGGIKASKRANNKMEEIRKKIGIEIK